MKGEEIQINGWARILLFIIPFLIIGGIFQLIGSLIFGVNAMKPESEYTTSENIVLLSFMFLGTLSTLWLFMKYVDRENFILLGFQTKSRGIDFLIGFGLGAVIIAIGYCFLLFIEEVSFQETIFDFKEIILIITLFTLVSLFEEVLMRGYVLKNLMLSMNHYVALVVSSILFSLMHAFNPNVNIVGLANLFIAGVLIGLPYIFTRNLWFSIALHLSWNLFQSLFGFNVSGRDTYSIIEFQIHEANYINGGDFGFEGSYLCVVAQIIAILGVIIYFNEKKIR